MAIGHTTSLFYCKLGGSQRRKLRRVQTAAAACCSLLHTDPPVSGIPTRDMKEELEDLKKSI